MSSLLAAGNEEENADRGGRTLMEGFDSGGGPCPSCGGRRCGGLLSARPFVPDAECICERIVGGTLSTTGEVIAGVAGRMVGELLLSAMGSRDSE